MANVPLQIDFWMLFYQSSKQMLLLIGKEHTYTFDKIGLVYTKYWLFFVFNKTKISQSSEFFPNNNSTFNGTVSILHGFHFFTKNLVSGSDASQMCFKPLVLNEI